ncbi:unnamed protein product [Dicrocoelium dendriticum]|nr:unnamed protein product [Dicrocoelium dendriticum]
MLSKGQSQPGSALAAERRTIILRYVYGISEIAAGLLMLHGINVAHEARETMRSKHFKGTEVAQGSSKVEQLAADAVKSGSAANEGCGSTDNMEHVLVVDDPIVDKHESYEPDRTETLASKSPEFCDGKKSPHSSGNRCHECHKRLGLTGLQCHCGLTLCEYHRYTDRHNCIFNYHDQAQAQIRKDNPTVSGEKVRKI